MSEKHDTPYGYCQCGCGEKAPVAKKTRNPIGHKKGEPIRFIRGHRNGPPIEERFWEKVDKRGPDECWEWKASRDKANYGQFQSPVGGAAHRAAIWLERGELAKGAVVMHTCDNPPCCNPRHLRVGTQAENLRDMREKRRAAHGERHSQTRLTEKTALEAIDRVNKGETRKSVAKDLGVSSGVIEGLVAGKTWKYLHRPESAWP